MKKLIFIALIMIYQVSFGYISKDYSGMTSHGFDGGTKKLVFKDFNKYLNTIKTNREKYYRITEFVGNLLSYGGDLMPILNDNPNNPSYYAVDYRNKKQYFTPTDVVKNTGNYYYQKVLYTIDTKLGVCDDYCRLFKYLCEQNKLKCDINGGFVKVVLNSSNPNNSASNTKLGLHSWIVADSFIIDPTFCDTDFKFDTMYFDIDPTIALYTYFNLSIPTQLKINKSLWRTELVKKGYNVEKNTGLSTIVLDSLIATNFHSTIGVSVQLLLKCDFDISSDANQITLTSKRFTYNEFLKTPCITHEYALSENKKTPYAVYDTIITKKNLFTHKEYKKRIEYKTETRNIYTLVDVEPIKRVFKEPIYYLTIK